jgi:hypothetical protein
VDEHVQDAHQRGGAVVQLAHDVRAAVHADNLGGREGMVTIKNRYSPTWKVVAQKTHKKKQNK